MRTTISKIALLAMVFILALSACAPKTPVATEPPVVATEPPVVATEPPVVATEPPAAEPFVFGILLVGAHNDQGWSQAHYDAGLYIEQNIPGSKMLYLENVYYGSPSYPGQTASQLAEQLVSQGATLVVFNSDDMKDEALKFANAHPGNLCYWRLPMDWTWKEGKAYTASANQFDIMGRMEYGKMMAGCAAALTTKPARSATLDH